MKLSLWIACFVWMGCSLAAKQTIVPRGKFAGEVVRDGGGSTGGLILELRSVNRIMPPERIQLTEDGTFEFRDIDPGQYNIRLMESNGAVIQEDFIMVRDNLSEWLVLRVHERPKAMPAGPGVISVEKLLHPVPSKATKEFDLASEASRTGNVSKSVQHLERAIRIYPEYMEAHNNLGVRFMNLDQFDKALPEFQKAVALDPASDKPHLNQGLALLGLGRYPEAEASVRRALQLTPRSVSAQYALGQILFAEEKTAEALENLRHAADQFPLARLLVAKILLQRGATPEAIAEFRRYLDTGHPDKRAQVKSWLEQLTRSAKP